jgi:HNH endonuclease
MLNDLKSSIIEGIEKVSPHATNVGLMRHKDITLMAMKHYTPERRKTVFYKKVNKNGSIPQHCPELGQCWEWVGVHLPNGYGTLSAKLVHRLSWVMEYGDIPNRLFVLHKCDNRNCVRPDHLFLGTQKQNLEDMCIKGRQDNGEKRYNHKLTWKKVAEIRKRYALGNVSQAKLAFEYDISRSVINQVLLNKTWKI